MEEEEEEEEEAAEEKIIAIIDTLPNTTPVSTSAQPQENIIRDIINPVIIEEVKPIQLRITIQPGDTAVFRRGTVLGMSCDAYSEVDNEVEFSWTKNGRFIDTTTGHVHFESKDNGNIIIYNAGPADEGLYQCVASNSEGVVFSRVSKVRQRRLVSSRRDQGSRSLPAPVWVVQPQALFQESCAGGSAGGYGRASACMSTSTVCYILPTSYHHHHRHRLRSLSTAKIKTTSSPTNIWAATTTMSTKQTS